MITLHFRWLLKQFTARLALMEQYQRDTYGLRCHTPPWSLTRASIPLDPPRSNSRKESNTGPQKHFASWEVCDALRSHNRPNVTDIISPPIGSPALAYQIERDRWEGRFTTFDIDHHGRYLLLPHGPSKFRSTVVELFICSEDQRMTETTIVTFQKVRKSYLQS